MASGVLAACHRKAKYPCDLSTGQVNEEINWAILAILLRECEDGSPSYLKYGEFSPSGPPCSYVFSEFCWGFCADCKTS
jgi:hypothetical protein